MKKNTAIKYAITTAIAGVFAILIVISRDFEGAKTLADKYRILADAFTIPGMLLVLIAAMVWISTTGFFDALTYAFGYVGSRMLPFFGATHKHETYYDYKVRKNDKRFSGYGFMFVVGAVFVLISIVFVYLHSTVYVPSV